jgi:hypothetical protein
MYEWTAIFMLSTVLFPGGPTGTVRSWGCLPQGLEHSDMMNVSLRSAPPSPVNGLHPQAPSNPDQTQGTLRTWFPNAIHMNNTFS